MVGGYDTSQFALSDNISWADVASDEKTWSVKFNGLKFKGGRDIFTKSDKVMIDTGVSYALVPKDDIDTISKALMGYDITCQSPGFEADIIEYKCSCDQGSLSSLPPIQLYIGSKFFDLPASNYIGWDANSEKCKLLLNPFNTGFANENKWVLGVEFLQQYYSIFDFENHRIGLVDSR